MAGMKNAIRRPNPSSTTLSGLVWRSAYNCYTTIVGGWLKLEFSWVNGEYVVKVADATLKTRGTDVDDAARIAVGAATGLLKSALATLTDAVKIEGENNDDGRN